MHPNNPNDVAAEVGALWVTYHDRLARVIAKKARVRAADPMVEDALTEAMIRTIRFLRAGGTFQGDPAGFLITVAWREYLRLHERASRTVPIDHTTWDDSRDPDLTEDVVLDGIAADLDGALKQALARLTPRQRAVLTDNHAGYTYEEIAERHDITYSAVNKAITRARQKLREDGRLGQAYHEWSD